MCRSEDWGDRVSLSNVVWSPYPRMFDTSDLHPLLSRRWHLVWAAIKKYTGDGLHRFEENFLTICGSCRRIFPTPTSLFSACFGRKRLLGGNTAGLWVTLRTGAAAGDLVLVRRDGKVAPGPSPEGDAGERGGAAAFSDLLTAGELACDVGGLDVQLEDITRRVLSSRSLPPEVRRFPLEQSRTVLLRYNHPGDEHHTMLEHGLFHGLYVHGRRGALAASSWTAW